MERKLKIAMIGHKRIPGREGGVEVVVEELAAQMAARGHSVTVYNRWDLFRAGGRTKEKEYRGVRIKHTPAPPIGGLNAFCYSALSTLRAVFGGYDVIHFHAIGCSSHVWFPHLLGQRTVVTIHGLDWQRAKWDRLATRYIIHGEHNDVRYADEIIVLSKGNQEYFMRRYERETLLIPNGYTPAVAPKADIITQKYGVQKGGYLLFLARIVPEKGLHYLLEAFRQVRTDCKLLVAGPLVGSEEYNAQIHDMAAKDGRVILLGFVRGQELAELYGNCACYVLPSDVEGMPMTILEALSYGARILTSDIEENVDAAKGCAFTFRHGDVEDLCVQLQDLLDHPEREMSAHGTQWETWDEVAEKTLDVYDRLVPPRKQRRVRRRIHGSAH